jgi:predicted NUDIX family NTP pyrophosphohydrolase
LSESVRSAQDSRQISVDGRGGQRSATTADGPTLTDRLARWAAMARRSAGILLHRSGPGGPEVLLGHMGGPYWARKDAGAWTIPKGEYDGDEDPWTVACREFHEELGSPVPTGQRIDLGEVRQSGGKVVRAWAVAGDLDPTFAVSNTFEIEWPPRSGRLQSFPELDRVAWFDLATAAAKIVTAQRELLARLLASGSGTDPGGDAVGDADESSP